MAEVIEYTPPPTIREFIKDYRSHELFYDWIVGPVGCLPGESEFLTPSGWKRMDAWTPGDFVGVVDSVTQQVRFEPAPYVKLPADQPFHFFDSGSLKMALSPEHKVLYDDYRGIRRTVTAGQMATVPSRRTIPTTFNLDRADNPAWSDAMIRLAVMFSADGHIPAAGRQVKVTICKDRKKARLRALLDAADIAWQSITYDSRPTEMVFTFEWPHARKDLGWVWALSGRQLGIVLEECLLWDGLADHEEHRYYSTDKANADAIQFAAHATGRRAVIHKTVDPRSESWAPLYTVSIRVKDNAKNRAMVRAETRISTQVAADGFKYCFTTSTGFFVARHANTVFLTGNSGKTTGLFFKLVYMAQLQVPGPDGIRRTRAVIVRNTAPQLKDTTIKSWDYWFKPGQAGDWRATEKNFILRFGDVECEVLFRPLDTPDDVDRVLSLEITFAIIDEFVQLPRSIIEALSARLGRYPSRKDGGATNWGMWGSSNPSTEDNWWHDYLHGDEVRRVTKAEIESGSGAGQESLNVKYFHQPSGFAEDAENLENLPPYDGSHAYYVSLAKGKKKAWVKQFLDAEWGFSADGTPVVTTFNSEWHVSKERLRFNPAYPLVVGLDPGLAGSALIFGQEDLHGRLLVLGELVQANYGAERLITELLKPYLRRHFPGADVWIAPDPAADNRAQTDERAVADVFRKHFPGKVKIETNNQLAKRLEAIESYTTRLTDAGPALLIDGQMCHNLTRALSGGWRYELKPKGDSMKPVPEKNGSSHPGDAFGYLCRYFHKLFERGLDRGMTVSERLERRPQSRPVRYNFR